MIVVDASAIIELATQPWTAASAGVANRIAAEEMHAPAFIDLEVTNAIRRVLQQGRISEEDAKSARDWVSDLPVHAHGHAPLLDRIWELRHRLTAYDAAYLALAEALDLPLVTCDRGLAEAAEARAELVHPAR